MSRVLQVCVLLLVLFSSCTGDREKRLNRRISLRRNDDNPYGAKVAYEGLPWLFPEADVSFLTTSPQNFYTSEDKRAIISISNFAEITPADVTALMNFVGSGNQVFISARWVSDTLLHTLGLRTSINFQFNFAANQRMDSLTLGVYSPVDGGYGSFSYPGDSYESYVSSLDSQYTSVLGRDREGHPNFVRISYKGGGAVYLHFAPLAFSNFFLLHKNNIGYYNTALSYLPSNLKQVYWDDYYRHGHGGRAFSALQYILNGDASTAGLRMAFWLLLLLFLLIYLFDSKRRQRLVPVIRPLRNTSLDFVQTIGRLYFQRRDNRNLAAKMAVHFQDQVRTRYHLPVTALDEDFVKRLAYRTGYPQESLQALVDRIRDLPAQGYVADEQLVEFYHQMEEFYKHA